VPGDASGSDATYIPVLKDSFPVIGDEEVSNGNMPCPVTQPARCGTFNPSGTTSTSITKAGMVGPPTLPCPLGVPALSGPPSLDLLAPARPRRVPMELGVIPFLIRRDGVWLYRGSPIERKEMVCLFASVLRREADGSWWLQTPAERGRISVEDAPFIAVELDWTGEGREQTLSFRTNVDEVITAGPEHPIRVAVDATSLDPTPYLLVRGGVGGAGIEARISRSVYYELVALAEPETVGGREMLGVWSRGCFFPLGDLPQDDE
jgi:hypothetical protein